MAPFLEGGLAKAPSSLLNKMISQLFIEGISYEKFCYLLEDAKPGVVTEKKKLIPINRVRY